METTLIEIQIETGTKSHHDLISLLTSKGYNFKSKPKEQKGLVEMGYQQALKWYKQGIEDAGESIGDGIDADFYDQYGEQFKLK